MELLLAASLFLLYCAWPAAQAYVKQVAHRTAWCMAILAALPIALRVALLRHFPVPTPAGSDDFSHLLVADTLAHFRLANPPHPFHRFFEAIYILQEPTYSSMYPPGQGVVLALGRLFGTPWAGVLLTVGAFCALCYWMLRAWTPPVWAFAGGLLAVFQFGPLNQWMNTYWANAIPAVAGCLVFGALPRLGRSGRWPAIALGSGLAIHLITRPFESILLIVAAALFLPFLPWRDEWPRLLRSARVVVLLVLPAVLLLFCQNRAVTGSWTTLPYMLSQYQYGIPATFVFQANPVPHRSLTQEQDLNYRAQSAIHGDGQETWRTFLDRLGYRVRYYRFFLLPPLYLAVIAFLLRIREWRYLWVVAAIAVFAVGSNFYPYFYPHYVNAVTCLFVLMSVAGLQQLRRWNIGRMLFLLSAALFMSWYAIRALGVPELLKDLRYDEWNFVNSGDPEGRIAINAQLARAPGKQLVFVHYEPRHGFHEWVHNDADIDAARVIWALDLGPEENQKLIRHYPDRHVWMVEPDARPPLLHQVAGSSGRLPPAVVRVFIGCYPRGKACGGSRPVSSHSSP